MKAPTRRNAPLSMNVTSLHRAIDPIENHVEKIYVAAKWYAENNFHIVPFVQYGDKMGYPKGVSQHHATSQLVMIEKWWNPVTGVCPGATIAMAHGGKSGFCALDLDMKGDIDGVNTLTDLIYAYGEYNDGSSSALDTLMATTPSGGRHLIFRYHPEIISNSEVSYPGVDTRGGLKRNPSENGGITFVDPSRKPGSKNPICYRWDDTITEIIDMPQWLVEVLNGRPPKRGGIQLQDSYDESAMGDHGEGRDRNIYVDLLRFVGIGYTEGQLWELMPKILERMNPPDEQMVKRKIESVLQSEAFIKAQNESERREKTDSLDLDKSDKGHILKTAKNLNTILNSAIFSHGYGDIRYDDFHHNYTKDGVLLAMVADYAVGINIWLSTNLNVDYGVDIIRKAVEYTAYIAEHVNAARDYMLNCPKPVIPGEQDFYGSGRGAPGVAFERLCTEVMDLDNPDLHKEYTNEHKKAYKAFLWFWLQGVVSRACVPGCKMEIMLNIFGSQGVGKSMFFRDLCPDPTWFTDSIQDTIVSGGRDNKDELSKLQSKLIVEMPELSPLKRGGKAGDDKMKQFISTQVDYFRRSYGTDTVGHPRTSALCGSSNNNDIYRDMTGDRRFVSIDHGNVPFKLGDNDNGVMDEIRDAMWGEIVASFKPGELNSAQNEILVCIPKALRKYQTKINSNHKYEEIGLPEMLEWLEDRSRVTWDEIILQAKITPGLRDAKESAIMIIVRQSLKNSDNFHYKKRCTRTKPDGKSVEKVNYWINLDHHTEMGQRAGVEVPPHWNTYIKSKQQPQPEEY